MLVNPSFVKKKNHVDAKNIQLTTTLNYGIPKYDIEQMKISSVLEFHSLWN